MRFDTIEEVREYVKELATAQYQEGDTSAINVSVEAKYRRTAFGKRLIGYEVT